MYFFLRVLPNFYSFHYNSKQYEQLHWTAAGHQFLTLSQNAAFHFAEKQHRFD